MMEDFEHKFEHYLQGHIHPDVQPIARRLTHPTLGRISMEAFLDVADFFEANRRALDEEMKTQDITGWDVEGEYIERTPLAQQDFDSHWKWGQM